MSLPFPNNSVQQPLGVGKESTSGPEQGKRDVHTGDSPVQVSKPKQVEEDICRGGMLGGEGYQRPASGDRHPHCGLAS